MYIYMPLGIYALCVFWNCCAGVNVSIRGRNWYSNMLRLSGGRGRALHKLSARQPRKKRMDSFMFWAKIEIKVLYLLTHKWSRLCSYAFVISNSLQDQKLPSG